MQRWKRLERVFAKLENEGPKNFGQADIEELIGLYRGASSDLARARSEGLGDDLEEYLNELIAKGHKQFYPPEPPRWRDAMRFFKRDFPRTVRTKSVFVFAAAALFIIPLCLSAWSVVVNPNSAFLLAPPEVLESLRDAYAEGHHGGRAEGVDSTMTGYYISNNIGVAFRCFATGVFGGLGTIFFLVVNGILSGAVGAYVCQAGFAESFLSFVVGHSAFELTAIVLSGSVGLNMGALLVNPGQLNRLSALRIQGPSMITVMLGAAAMLLIAALIEGFWSPSGAPPVLKYAIGAILWLLVISYLALAGQGVGGKSR
jgi:uncharacterized membrane protein SpoIIM required for sporulation